MNTTKGLTTIHIFFIHAMDLDATYELELVGSRIAIVSYLSTLEKNVFIQPPTNFEGHKKKNFLQNLALKKCKPIEQRYKSLEEQ